MKELTCAFALIVVVSGCSRQPIGIAGSPNQPINAPMEEGRVDPDPEIEAARAIRDSEDLDQERVAEPMLERGETVDEAEARANSRDMVRSRRQAMQRPRIESNETAEIENQASIGQAPIADPDDLERPDEPEAPLLTFQKSNCFGDCEAYTFSLREGGMMSLLVDKGEVAQGLYNRTLYSVDYERLNNYIDSLRLMNLEAVYPVEEDAPVDIPYRLITLPDENGYPRNIKVYYGAPPALNRFLDRLEALIEEQSWERVYEESDDR